jgi:hypothetical protein
MSSEIVKMGVGELASESMWETEDHQLEEAFHPGLSPDDTEKAIAYRRKAERIMDGDNAFKRPVKTEDLYNFAECYLRPMESGKYRTVNQAARLTRVPYFVAHALIPARHLRLFYLGWPPMIAMEEVLADAGASIVVDYSDQLKKQEQMALQLVSRGLQGDEEVSAQQLRIADKVIDRVRGKPTERKESINFDVELELSPEQLAQVAEIVRGRPKSIGSGEPS